MSSDLHGWPLEVFVSLVMTAHHGVALERLVGVRDGQDALLAAVDAMLARHPGSAP